ncbi:hypothetical protein CLAFUW4_07316 [Fulvia fulva]|uniref:Myb-like DNA-binding domain-containing protein n=1 Tax=Passalora fulva TaxID=5499 RepID=A0A9Q8PA05_PASFU|nr:uncharacterized protein CLAFUR5_07445 [Fulvia fulva]KAK4622320.1 hypothetical protein CLAFUR4_07323 [Fulvia fulva]KAK4622943.1 hypothetical protein CLAFUR0_07321 [Fulvia fulva]UJO18644.1 hypothetical protein CLAFUR5_07445 [Fulvia fulva]WPV16148.1 hypothetical protein CLAFUW4_07316 [Fulvia fulva]WPV31601.1 hypothetical protein CLAFUW7_07317 [Fulvia fulva]
MSSENDTSNTSADAGNSHFTAAEVKFVLAALQHAEGGTLKFDYDAVAAQLGLKNGKTARARWNTIARTKINNAASAGGVSKAGPSKKKAAPKKAAGEELY